MPGPKVQPYTHIDSTVCEYSRANVLHCTYDTHFLEAGEEYLKRVSSIPEESVADQQLPAVPTAVFQYNESRSSVELEDMAKGTPKVTVKVYADTDEQELARIAKLALDTWKSLRGQVGA